MDERMRQRVLEMHHVLSLVETNQTKKIGRKRERERGCVREKKRKKTNDKNACAKRQNPPNFR